MEDFNFEEIITKISLAMLMSQMALAKAEMDGIEWGIEYLTLKIKHFEEEAKLLKKLSLEEELKNKSNVN